MNNFNDIKKKCMLLYVEHNIASEYLHHRMLFDPITGFIIMQKKYK